MLCFCPYVSVSVSAGLGIWCAGLFSLTTRSFVYLIALLEAVLKEAFGIAGPGPGYFLIRN